MIGVGGFGFSCGFGFGDGMYEDELGDWVKVEDHIAEVERLNEQIKMLQLKLNIKDSGAGFQGNEPTDGLSGFRG